MKVLSVASEVFPLIKTGGLADVAGAEDQDHDLFYEPKADAVPVHYAELAANPRARSAVLRVAEKLDGQGRLAA